MARLQKKYTDIIYIYSCISSSGVHSFSLSPSQANTCIMALLLSFSLPSKHMHHAYGFSLMMGIHCLFWWAVLMVINSFSWCVLPLQFLSLQFTTPSSALSLSHTHTHMRCPMWGCGVACAAGACCDTNVMCCDVVRVHAVMWCGIWCDAAPTGHQRVNNPSSAMVAAV